MQTVHLSRTTIKCPKPINARKGIKTQ